MELRAVMSQIPNINMAALDQYDQRLMGPSSQKLGDKKRRDQFKKLVEGAVGVIFRHWGAVFYYVSLEASSEQIRDTHNASHYKTV